MKKDKRKRAIAVLLTAALMVGVIKGNSGSLMAVETFSGVNEIVNGNRDFVILEIVDDVSEASVGYLVSGQEPNDLTLNGLSDAAYAEFLEKLRRQGLLAANDNDDQSSYPIEHRVTERIYSDKSRKAENAEGEYWANFDGYRERGLTMVSGYFEPVFDPEDNEVYYYYLEDDFEISTMTKDQLEDVAVRLMRSYEPEGHPHSKPGRFFTFSVEEPESDETDMSAAGAELQSGPVPYTIQEEFEAAGEEEPEAAEESEGSDVTEEPEGSDVTEEPEETEGSDVTEETEGPDAPKGPDVPEETGDQEETESEPESNAVDNSDEVNSNEQEETKEQEEAGSSETASAVSRSDGSVIRVSIDLERSVLVVSADENVIANVLGESGSDEPTDEGNATDEGDEGKDGNPTGGDGDGNLTGEDGDGDPTDEGKDGNPTGTPDPEEPTGTPDPEKTTDDLDDESNEGDETYYTVSYEWSGLPDLNENWSVYEYTGEDFSDSVSISISCPQDDNSYEKGTPYTVDSEYNEGREIVITDNNGATLGVYSFSGWREREDDSGQIVLWGEWKQKQIQTQPSTLARSDDQQYIYEYSWEYNGDSWYCPPWLVANIDDTSKTAWTKQDNKYIFTVDNQEYEVDGTIFSDIVLPVSGSVIDTKYSNKTIILVEGILFSNPENPDDSGDEPKKTPLGQYVFSGWGEPDEVKTVEVKTDEVKPDEDDQNDTTQTEPEGTVTKRLTGIWTYESPSGENKCNISYQFNSDGGNTVPSELINGDNGRVGYGDLTDQVELVPGTVLPNGTVIDNHAILYGMITPPAVTGTYCSNMRYNIDTQYNEDTVIEVRDKDTGQLIGMYRFSGWTEYNDAGGKHKIEDGIIERLNGDTTISGTWTYTPVSNAKYVEGYGYQYEYIKDKLVNHDWFKYYVLGLDESQNLNVKVTTYTPDGRHLLGADFGNLTEAMNRADLVVLNADGGYLVVDNDKQTTEYKETGDISADAAKILLSRACANEQAKRLAVVVDSSVLNAKIGNMKKIAVLLQQPDIGRAYEDLMARARFEDSYDNAEWKSLRQSVKSLNGGNFVRENVYFVSYKNSSFKGTTYRDTDVDATSVFSLVNADFENQYSDSTVDSGFADVYRAILNENYTRGQNGQKSMDEYVTPAVAVAYILNYRNYDPVIYKDQIRVLELEPCMDFTYYYPGSTDTDAGRKAKDDRIKQFIKDWAPSFKEKYAQDPNAVVIDGMTTAEFCGKIADVYEDYDLIYFGSNTGLFNTSANVPEWQERDSCPETLRDVKGRYWLGYSEEKDGPAAFDENGESRNTGFFSYIDGQWYVSFSTDTSHTGSESLRNYWIKCSSGAEVNFEVTLDEVETYGGNSGYTVGTKYGNGAWEWRWLPQDQKWQLRAPDKFIEFCKRDQPDRVLPVGWVDDTPADIYSIERILKAEAHSTSTDNLRYQYKNGKWYRHPNENDGRFYVEDFPIDHPGSGNWLYSRGNETDSEWRWVSDWDGKPAKWEQKVTYSDALTLYNDQNMNGMVYTHIGDFFTAGEGDWFDYGGLLENETVDGKTVSRYSGNDILEWQVDELLNFLKSGSPIIVANDFMTYDNQENISGINSSDVTYSVRDKEYHGILDTSSYVYRFVKKACDAGYLGKGLLVKGPHDKVDTAAALNQQKLRLNLFDMPTPYDYTETTDDLGAIVGCTYLRPESDGKYYLNYEFSITNLNAQNPLTTRYDVKLFLDSNNDGIYNTALEELEDITVINAQTGAVQERISGAMDAGGGAVWHYSLSAGTPYRVRRELPQGYVGAIGWKLTATQVGNTGIHDSAIGLTAVQKQRINSDKIDPVTGKRIIHVLQITRNSGITLNLEECMEKAENRTTSDDQWKTLLESIPDFDVRFDAISVNDFAYSFDHEETEGHLVAGSRDNYLNFYEYDMVILGFGDNYDNLPSKKATEALLAYGDSGKSLMYTHDTTYSHSVLRVTEEDFNGGNTSTLSMSIRNQCGMDRFGVSVNRFFSNGQYNPIKRGVDITLPDRNNNEISLFNSAANDRLGSDIAYKPGSGQSVMAAQTQGFTYVGMNIGLEGYANLNYSAISSTYPYSYSGWDNRKLWMKEPGTVNNNIVTRVNSGIITQYPYDIKEEIVVSNTHAQYFQVDLDTDWDSDGRGDIVVWYCISSLDNSSAWNEAGEFKPNDIYDYSPNDVRNNYYIYNKGNITYTGVGHDKNFTIDEMKLFINTFIAAYNAGIHDPSVRIVDGPSTNAPDLESVSLPFMAEDAESAGTQRVYYQVEDNNITTGTKNLSVTYYLEGGSSEVKYQGNTISAEMYAGNPDPDHPEKKALQTYDAQTNLPVSYDAIRSGRTYYIDVPLGRLVDNESFNLYVKIDLKLEGSNISAASDIDRLLISKLKMFNLD